VGVSGYGDVKDVISDAMAEVDF
ncbi:hypothetical protein A2U01_0087905, partial [Trifolium medium]|nr:hypothetical protein [Trifolium medium]